MDSILTGVVSGVVVVFLAWLAKRVFLSRRLFLIQPKLFDYSDFVDSRGAKTVELTIFNGGSRVEEDVRIQLSPSFTYTVIASDKSGLSVDSAGVLAVDRLAPKQDFTVVMTAEGGEFRKEHVIGISSKETVGKIKDKLQDAQLSPEQSALIFFVFFVALPIVGYLVGRFVEREVWPVLVGVERASEAEAREVGSAIKFLSKSGKASSSYGVSARRADELGSTFLVEGVRRVGNLVFVEIAIKNSTKSRLQYTFQVSSQVSERREEAKVVANYIETGIVAFASTEKSVSLSEYLPVDVSPQILVVEARVDDPNGDRVWRTVEVILE